MTAVVTCVGYRRATDSDKGEPVYEYAVFLADITAPESLDRGATLEAATEAYRRGQGSINFKAMFAFARTSVGMNVDTKSDITRYLRQQQNLSPISTIIIMFDPSLSDGYEVRVDPPHDIARYAGALDVAEGIIGE